MKISTRLWLLFLLVAVLPLALSSFFELRQSEATLRALAQSSMSDLADKKAIQIRSYLKERVRDVRQLAKSPEVIEAVPGSRSAARDKALFRRYLDRYGDEFYDLFMIDPDGEIYYTQKHEADFDTNLLSGPWKATPLAQAFREARMTLEPVISTYEYYPPSSAPALFIAAPIMKEGKFVGVFAAQLDTRLFYKVATDATGLGVSGEVVFAQRDGSDALYTAPLKHHPDAAMKFRLPLAQIADTPISRGISGESGNGVKPDYSGRKVVAAWRYLPELRWGMAVNMDAEEVFAPIYRQRKMLLEALAALLFFSGFAAYYFGRQISRPLEALAKTADEMAEGNLDQRADESAPGEVGAFALAFNRMAAKLQGFYHTLEDRIEERTRELNVSNEQLQEEIIERTHIEASLVAANEELARNQLLLNEAQRLGQIGSWQLDHASGELLWSDEIWRIFELDPREFAPSYENFLHAIHPDDRSKVDSAYQESLKNRQPYDVEHRLLMPDGRVKWVREHCTNDFDAMGKPLRSVGAVQDITEQKQAEEHLRIAAVTFETHEGIMITDRDGRILRVNQSFQEITGYTAEEVLGQNPRILSSGRQSREFYEKMWRKLLSEGSWSGEIWDRRKNGEVYPKWLTITAVEGNSDSTAAYVAIFSDITARKRAEEEIRNLAFYDALTGLPNRRLLLDRFQLALSLSQRSQHYGALFFLDMDKFKILNDTLGHDYGDMMLVEVARRIQSCVREVDTVARLGGDEFVVLLEEISADLQEASQKASVIAEKIRSALCRPYLLKGHEHHSSPSIGVSIYRGNQEPVDVLMKQADMAMYQAKDAGRNTVRFFDPLMQQAVEARALLEADLRRALPNKELRLYYQIQVDHDRRAIGAEALIRWIHPRRGLVSPAEFIPIAEESALILSIGHWVIETACRQLAEWAKDEKKRHLVLAVNVSAQQFRLSNFVQQIEELIERFRIVPGCLKLELTESVVLDNVSEVVTKMQALKALGIRLSLDDFGTGYSSLSYLKRLPLDQIKIDQSFVRDMNSDQSDAVMVQTIIDLAQNFGLKVIAEGVETDAQLESLKRNGCMAYQGYLFGRPVPIEDFEKLLN